MGKGKQQRRRAQNALKALQGNLHKAQFGKASASLPLPDAPTKEQLQEKVPASLRKVMALKALVQREDVEVKRKARAKLQAAAAAGAGTGGPEEQPAEEQAVAAGPGKGRGGVKAAAGAGKPEPGPGAGGGAATGGKRGGPDGAAKNSGLSVFEAPAEETKLKTKKKEYLKRKAEKKKAKRHGAVDPSDVQLRDHVKFGEVAAQPLEVQLKRKHWAAKERTANDRCKDIFLKQMEEAKRRMAPEPGDAVAHATGATGAAGHGKGSGVGGAKARQQQQQQVAGGKRKAQQPAKNNAEQEALRLQVIQAYRSQKKRPAEGGADLGTLARLVRQKPAPAAAASE